MTILDTLVTAFKSIESKLDAMDAKYDHSPDPYLAMPTGTKHEYTRLTEQLNLLRTAIAREPNSLDIQALNDPNYND